MPKRKSKDPDVIRLENCTAPAVPSVTITNLSLPDMVQLSEGTVPEWVQANARWWLEAKPGELNPHFQTHGAEATEAERQPA